MPAIITHDTFGRDIYHSLYRTIGESRDELDAFLLGNQGPDVLFYGAINPLTAQMGELGSRMHRERPTEMLLDFLQNAQEMPDDAWFAALSKSGHDAGSARGAGGMSGVWNAWRTMRRNPAPTASVQNIAKAYVLGLICHYELDSKLHPFIYAQQWAICDAGVPELDRSCSHEVHATIESELDEMVLTVRRGETIGTFDPSERILRASDHVLEVISALYFKVSAKVFDTYMEPDAFKTCVKSCRQAMRIIRSSSGVKRELIGRAETLFRRYSFLRAFSHRNIELHESMFDNHEHDPWKDPETGAVSHAGFWDLYEQARICAEEAIPVLAVAEARIGHAKTADLVRKLTCDLNFNGETASACIVSTETVL